MFIEKGLEQRFRAFFQFFDNFCNGALAAVKFTEGSLEKRNAFWRELTCMDAERMEIQGCKAERITECTAARRNVIIDLERTAYECISTYLIALLYCRRSAESGKLADAHMPTELASIRDNGPLANLAIVPNVGISHNQNARSDARAATTLSGTAIQRRIFANNAIFANFKACRLASVLQILRRRPKNRTIVNMRIRLDGHTAIHTHSRFEHHIFTDFDPFINNAPRANNCRLVDFSGLMNVSGRMEHGL